MNKLSKLTALLLALLLAIGAPMAAVAETITTEKQYEEHVSAILAQLYESMMDGATYEELLEATKTMTRTEIVNFLERLKKDGVDDDLAEYDAHIQELYDTYMVESVDPDDITNPPVGPLMPPITGTSVLTAMSRSATSIPSTDKTGMKLTKDVDWDKDANEGTITLEAFATGSKVTTISTTQVPTDIVFVLDLSRSMNHAMDDTSASSGADDGKCYTAVGRNETLNTDETYHVLTQINNKNVYLTVKWCTTCSAWTHGCNHLNANQDTPGTPYVFGEVTFYTTTRRLAALQSAVENFSYAVFEMAKGNDGKLGTADDVKHRIAVIGYNTTTYLMVDGSVSTNYSKALVDVSTTTGQNAVLGNFDALWSNTAQNTKTADGISAANSVFNSNAVPLEGETARNRVMILFTDGAPNNSGNNTNAYDAAISAANTTKNTHGATVYSIATISGAKPSSSPTDDMNKMLHYISTNYPNATSRNNPGTGDYTAGYYLATTNANELNNIFQSIASQLPSGGSSTELSSSAVVTDVLTNTFELPNGASSVRVYMAKCTGVTTGTDGKTYTFDDDVTATSDPRVQLYPNNQSATWCADNAGFTAEDFANVGISIDSTGRKISVTGFDFAKYYCGLDSTQQGGGTTSSTLHPGVKLIIEIDIEPIDGFLGGNNVETNVTASSGVFENSSATTPVIPMPEATNADVFIYKLEVSGGDQHIYLSNTADLHEFTMNFCDEYTIKVYEKKTEDGKEFDTTSKLVSTDTYKVNGVNNQYVTLTYTLKDANNNVIGVYTIAPGKTKGEGSWSEGAQLNPLLTADTTEYKVECKITPTVTGFYPTKSHEASDYIYVYKPQVTFQDTRHEFHTAATADGYYDANNYVKDSLKWYNAELQQYSTEATITDAETGNTVNAMLGTPPTLTFTYTLGSDTWITNNVVTGTACVPVNVTNVLIDGDNEITINASTNADSGYLTTNRTMPYTPCADCKDVHGTTTPTNVASGRSAPYEFVVHIYNVYGKLQITKTGLKDGESAIFKVYNATKNGDAYTKGTLYTNVVLTGDGSGNAVSVTLGELYPDTSYFVEEASGWSWSYTVSPTSAGATIVANDTVTVSFSNTKNDQWLHDENGIVNNFGTDTKTDLDNEGGE